MFDRPSKCGFSITQTAQQREYVSHLKFGFGKFRFDLDRLFVVRQGPFVELQVLRQLASRMSILTLLEQLNRVSSAVSQGILSLRAG